MKCPRCEGSILDERDRDGVTIDVCRECRGVWLDRGELEKLVSRASQEMQDHDHSPRSGDADDYEDAPSGGLRGAGERRTPERKRRWFETLGEIFD